jgi:hypothetical protein
VGQSHDPHDSIEALEEALDALEGLEEEMKTAATDTKSSAPAAASVDKAQEKSGSVPVDEEDSEDLGNEKLGDEEGEETSGDKNVNYGYHPIIDFFHSYRWSAAAAKK